MATQTVTRKPDHKSDAPKQETPKDAPKVETPKPSAPAFTFGEAAIPEKSVKRSREPNPFAEVVKGLAEQFRDEKQDNKAKTVGFTMPAGEERAAAVSKMLRQMSDAGHEHNVSIRKNVSEDGDKVTVQFWAAEKISRPRKPAETVPAAV